jgi:1-deoxy-D-xylulose-5-phosphate reductoisomerase
LRTPASELGRVTVEKAVKHPNWKMGSKISIDSATLMNKGLELIEACALFNLPESQVDVVVHPQSVVHSLVEFQDGSMLAQMSSADMRIPIAYSLSYPERIVSGAKPLRLTEIARLDFDTPDIGRFPCLRVAREAARTGGNAPAILNAANEIAVQAFQDKLLGFMNIPELIERVLEACPYDSITDLNQVLSIDLMARRVAREILQTKSWPKTVSGN